ncbi:hypothetical protein R2083_11705 [Nitrosomonas sp. Is35]|uniref:hypothetical protein n=1 Tax=Nitrosomonas sp. Is35 TaxID=3080534 RepID=UPI00294B5847|nr:hypothetical protein [Nitrosomonas sp. Is35]MDV6348180.1 hypothetical protein [Nitrosomonas sp. Is35]
MKLHKIAAIWLVVSMTIISQDILAEGGTSSGVVSWVPVEPWLIYVVIGVILLGGFVSLNCIMSALSKSKWSLADALSEEASVVSLEADGSGGFKPRLGADGKPIMITELRASSSRMIALVGMILILLMFLGFGIFAMYSFAKTGVMPNPENMVNFLAAGMTLFAPYLVNQFSALFEKLAPKKS